MSWDVSLMPIGFQTGEGTHGPRETFVETIRRLLPESDVTVEDSSSLMELYKQAGMAIRPEMADLIAKSIRGRVEAPEYRFEMTVSCGEDDVKSVGISVRASSGDVLPVIERLAKGLNAIAIDNGSLEEIDFASDPGKGLRDWNQVRDAVIDTVGRDDRNEKPGQDA